MSIVPTAAWQIKPPNTWPPPPEFMSFSALREIESCPRRWALGSANYPDIWDGRGYPSALPSVPLEGIILHKALEQITVALASRGCPSIDHESAVAVLKELGGLSNVVSCNIEDTLKKFEKNPRSLPHIQKTYQRLQGQVPNLRIQVQSLLSRLKLAPKSKISTGDQAATDTRTALQHGSHTEVELQVHNLKWRGIVDLLSLSTDICEIRDFKSGSKKDEHRFQLQAYAVLWVKDHERNPTGRPAERLLLSYQSGDVEVTPLDAEQLEATEVTLRTRSENARRAVQQDPPKACPSEETCQYCTVRHLCDDYWQWTINNRKSSNAGTFFDLQIKLSGGHGDSSWSGVVEACLGLAVGNPIMFRPKKLPFDLRPGQHLRMLNVHVTSPTNDNIDGPTEIAVATASTSSEVFVLSED